MLVMFIGCGKKGNDDSASRNTTTKIVTGKIESTPPKPAEDKTVKQMVSAPPTQPVVSPSVEKAPLEVVTPPPPAVEKPEALSSREAEKAQQPIAEEHPEAAILDDSAADTTTASDTPISTVYDPTDKIDPFRPLFADTSTTESDEMDREQPVKRREKRKPVTPLERVDLSQLTLVGVVSSPEKNRALIEEMNGKGYIVNIGTYIGINSGKVVQILRDRIVIEEEVEDVLGKISLQKRELKLQKPLGDE